MRVEEGDPVSDKGKPAGLVSGHVGKIFFRGIRGDMTRREGTELERPHDHRHERISGTAKSFMGGWGVRQAHSSEEAVEHNTVEPRGLT